MLCYKLNDLLCQYTPKTAETAAVRHQSGVGHSHLDTTLNRPPARHKLLLAVTTGTRPVGARRQRSSGAALHYRTQLLSLIPRSQRSCSHPQESAEVGHYKVRVLGFHWGSTHAKWKVPIFLQVLIGKYGLLPNRCSLCEFYVYIQRFSVHIHFVLTIPDMELFISKITNVEIDTNIKNE